MLCLACLGAGVALGYLIRGERAPSARTVPALVAEPSPPERVHAEAPSLRRALDEIPAPDVPRGTGRIVGTVVDDGGRPVAGVEVSAFRVDMTGPAMPRHDLEEEVRRYVTWLRTYDVPVAQVVTGSDGAFVLDGLADEDHSVRAWVRGYDIEHDFDEYRPGAELRLVARALVEVRVEIVLPDGTQPRSAEIRLSWRHASGSEDWTPDSPTLRLAAGAYEVQAIVSNEDGTTFQSKERTVVVEAAPQTIRFAMSATSGVSGGIGPGKLCEGDSWEVRALRIPDGEQPARDRLVQDGHRGVAGDDSYWIDELPPGRYLVGLVHLDRTVLRTKIVDLGAEPVHCDFDLAGPPSFRVRVLGPEGKPVQDALVRTWTERPMLSGACGAALLQPDGSFLVVDADEGPAERLVEARSERYGEKRVPYRAGLAADIDVRFEPAAWLRVDLEGADGIDVRARLVLWRGVRPDVVAAGDKVAEHRFEIGPAQPGTFELIVSSDVSSSVGPGDSMIVARREIRLAAGRNEATVQLPRRHRLSVTGLPPNATVRLHPEGPLRWNPFLRSADRDGNLVLERLPEGRYLLDLGEAGMAVQLDGPGEVRFVRRPFDAFEVRATDSALGLRTGDLIVGAAGKEFGGVEEARPALTAPEAVLLVRRGGATVELRVDTKALRRALEAGEVSMDPTLR